MWPAARRLWRAWWLRRCGGGDLREDRSTVTAAVAVGTQAALAAKLRTARRLAAKLEAARGCLAEQARLACRRDGPLRLLCGVAGEPRGVVREVRSRAFFNLLLGCRA